MQKIKILALSLAACSLMACGETPKVQNVNKQSTAWDKVKSDVPDKDPVWNKHLTGTVLLRDISNGDNGLIPWDKGEVAAVLKADWRTVAGEGKVYENGFLAVDIDLEAKVKTMPFKEMLIGPSNSFLSLNRDPYMENNCDFSNLQLSDPELKVHPGQLSLNNGMPIAGTNDPKAESGFAEMLYADRKAKIDGLVPCQVKIGDSTLNYEHEFFVDLGKGWNFLTKEFSFDGNNLFKTVYKATSNPTTWVATKFSDGPDAPEDPQPEDSDSK